MRKRIIIEVLTVSIFMFVGCGGGGNSANSTPTIDNSGNLENQYGYFGDNVKFGNQYIVGSWFLSQRDIDLSGIAIAATLEGIRPMLIEIQALVAPAYYGTPQRTTTGFDSKRMSMLLAVLEKRCDLRMSSQDVFLNIAGGIKVKDPSIDLSAVIAIASSFNDFPIKDNVCFVGEVGLSGEIRPARQLEKRITEAEKLGFDKIYISSYNKNINFKRDYFKLFLVFRLSSQLGRGVKT